MLRRPAGPRPPQSTGSRAGRPPPPRPGDASALFFHLDPLPLCCIGSPRGRHVMSRGSSAAGGGLRGAELRSEPHSPPPPPGHRSRPCPRGHPPRRRPHPAGESEGRGLAALPHAAPRPPCLQRPQPGRRGHRDIVCRLPLLRTGLRLQIVSPDKPGRAGGAAGPSPCPPPAALPHCGGGPAGARPRSAGEPRRSPLTCSTALRLRHGPARPPPPRGSLPAAPRRAHCTRRGMGRRRSCAAHPGGGSAPSSRPHPAAPSCRRCGEPKGSLPAGPGADRLPAQAAGLRSPSPPAPRSRTRDAGLRLHARRRRGSPRGGGASSEGQPSPAPDADFTATEAKEPSRG